MDRIAVAFSPLRDASPQDILSWSRRAEDLGFAGVFIPESFNDSLAYAQAVAAATSHIEVGTGHRPVNASLGIDMGDPLERTREIVGVLRAAWEKGPHQPRPRTPPPILAAALARPMVELAGEIADGV